jgi:Protein of unknown function (DUF3147)
MKISLNLTAIGRTRWYEYALRFLFGGAMTVLAWLIAKKYGPVVGGLFLAFPAIFPSTATLIESHEKKRGRRGGRSGTLRGRKLAAEDAGGATIGAFGLLIFAYLSWKFIPEFRTWITLLLATAGWVAIAIVGWYVWQFCLTIRK